MAHTKWSLRAFQFTIYNSYSTKSTFISNQLVTFVQTNPLSCNGEGTQYAVILTCHLRKWFV